MRAFKSSLLPLISLLGVLTLSACNLPSPQDPAAVEGWTKSTSNPSDKEQTPATFNVEFMTSRSAVLESRTEGTFALPTSRVFNLYACVKDIGYSKPVQGHRFLIEEINQEARTDSTGCFSWKEKIEFNFLADSKYIRMNRSVKALGLHRGSRRISFAINPWSHGETLTPVLEIKPNSEIPQLVEDTAEAQRALKGLSNDNQIRPRALWVEDGRLFVTEDKMTNKGVSLTVEFRTTPTLMLTKMNGELFQRNLTSGSFTARIKLIHLYKHNGEEVRRLLGESEKFSAVMANGSLAIRTPILLTNIPTRGQVLIGMELNPVNGPEGLASFDGVYLVGEYDNLKTSAFLKLSTVVAQTKGFKLANYINASFNDENSSDQNLDRDAYQKPKIEIDELSFPAFRIGKETPTTRELFYSVKACLKNGVDQKVTRAHTFTVTKFRQSESEPKDVKTIKTINNACITWKESIEISYYDCHRYLKGFVTIENKDLGMSERLEIIVNPWEPQGTFARDLRFIEPDEQLPLSCQAENRPPSQIYVESYGYNTLSFPYAVDNLLNLTVKKKIQLKIEPRVLVYSSLMNGHSEPAQKLRDGVYLLKTAIIRNKDYDSENTLVSSDSKLVQVISGQINTSMTYSFQDLKAIANRNNLLIEIYPVLENKIQLVEGQFPQLNEQELDGLIDLDAKLLAPTSIGPININVDEASRPANLLDASTLNIYLTKGLYQQSSPLKSAIDQVVLQGRVLRTQSFARLTARKTPGAFAKENNLALINLSELEDKEPLAKSFGAVDVDDRLIITKKDLAQVIQSGTLSKVTAQRLCAFWVNNFLPKLSAEKGGMLVDSNAAYNMSMNCYTASGRDPKLFFQAEKRISVKEISGSKFIRGYNQGLNVGTSFSLSTNHSVYATKAHSISAKTGLGWKFFDLFTLGADVNYSMSWSDSNGNATVNSASVNSATYLTVQQNIYDIQLSKYEQCAVIRLNPRLFVKDSGQRDYVNSLNPRLTEDELVEATSRGMLLCDGTVSTKPLVVNESYYLIAQEVNSSQMQDIGDARNRNFFIVLRSSNDFLRFVTAIKGRTVMPNSSEKETAVQDEATNNLMHLFDLPAASSPGMYLVR